MDMMRIPLATVLFVGSVGLLYAMWKPEQIQFLAGLDSTTSGLIAIGCICCLVYSIILYTNMDIVR